MDFDNKNKLTHLLIVFLATLTIVISALFLLLFLIPPTPSSRDAAHTH
jgi:hypothetical protein